MKFGLIGKKLGHTWSQEYFEQLFADQRLQHSYDNIELPELTRLSKDKLLSYRGLNVTSPYKEAIIPMLDELSTAASTIEAVNCISIEGGRAIGHNTDAFGFRDSLRPFLKSWHNKALVLGTGGASKAITYVLDQLGIDHLSVSRTPAAGQLSYADINEKALEICTLVINCTPLGMAPDIDSLPEIAYAGLNEKNLLYDLVYNPKETAFLSKGKEKGSQIINGHHMLIAQADESWRIWNHDSASPTID